MVNIKEFKEFLIEKYLRDEEVYINPSAPQVKFMMKKSRYRELRVLVPNDINGDIYVWDGAKKIHWMQRKALYLNKKDYDDDLGVCFTMGTQRNADPNNMKIRWWWDNKNTYKNSIVYKNKRIQNLIKKFNKIEWEEKNDDVD